MTKQEIKEFLNNKPGYIKEGGKRLRQHLINKGFQVTTQQCKNALCEVRVESKSYINIKPNQPLKVLIYDLETSYNIVKSWRVGYQLNINPSDILHERAIICVSYKWLDEDTIYNITWDKNQCDKFLIEQFIEVLNDADLIVAHNGDRFDLKWIKTRAIKHDLPMLIDYNQFDTLKVAKKKFLFNSNKLDYISEFLGFGNKIKTNMALWDDIILRKSKEAMIEMVKYCDMDVELLEKVYKKLVSWEKPKTHLGVIQGKTKQTSPITGSNNIEFVKKMVTNQGTIKYIMKDSDTSRLFEMSATNYNKFLEINN